MTVEFYSEALKGSTCSVTGGTLCNNNAEDTANMRDDYVRALTSFMSIAFEDDDMVDRVPARTMSLILDLVSTLQGEVAAGRRAIEKARQAATVRTFAGGD